MSIIEKIKESLKKANLFYRNLWESKSSKNKLEVLLMAVIFLSLCFIPIYKIATNLQVFLFQSNSLVLSTEVKASLPMFFALGITLIGLSIYIMYLRERGKGLHMTREINRNTGWSKKVYLSFFILLLAFFIIIKVPYWHNAFTINHPLKYSTYAEPALKMFKEKDPFVLQRQYMHNPITDSRGIGFTFGNLPAIEWILFLSYSLFYKIATFEVITRAVMAVIGLFALVSIFRFLSRSINYAVALISSAFLAFNPIYNLSSYITVYDTLNLGISFLSFNRIFSFNKTKDIKHLLLAGIILGLGASIKENILLWSLPIIGVMLIQPKSFSIITYLKNLILLGLATVFPLIITNISITNFPKKDPIDFMIFVILTVIFFVIYKWRKKLEEIVGKLSDTTINIIRRFPLISFVILVIVAFLAVKKIYSLEVSEEFLTDSRLLFNYELYERMFSFQLVPFLTIPVFILGALSVLIIPTYVRKRRIALTLVSLSLGSLVYLILASKSLYFHYYYWLIIITTGSVIAALGLFYISKTFKYPMHSLFFIFSLVSSICFLSFVETRAKLNRDVRDMPSLVRFIEDQDIKEGESFIDQADATYLSFKTNLLRVYSYDIFSNERFKEEVRKNGIPFAMEKFKIRYLITNGGEALPDLIPLTNALSRKELASTSYRRTDAIYSDLYARYPYIPDMEIRKEILEENKLEEQLRVVKKFNNFIVYSFKRACFNTILK